MPAVRRPSSPWSGTSVASIFAGFAADTVAQGVHLGIAGGLGDELGFFDGPVPYQQDGAQEGGGKHREGSDPRHQVEARRWRRGQDRGAVFGGERVEDLLGIIAIGDASAEQ